MPLCKLDWMESPAVLFAVVMISVMSLLLLIKDIIVIVIIIIIIITTTACYMWFLITCSHVWIRFPLLLYTPSLALVMICYKTGRIKPMKHHNYDGSNTKQQCDRHRAGRQVQDFPRKKVPRCGSMDFWCSFLWQMCKTCIFWCTSPTTKLLWWKKSAEPRGI